MVSVVFDDTVEEVEKFLSANLAKYKLPMPNQNASDDEIRGYVAYFKWADQHLQPRDGTTPQPSAPGTSLPPSQTPNHWCVGAANPVFDAQTQWASGPGGQRFPVVAFRRM